MIGRTPSLVASFGGEDGTSYREIGFVGNEPRCSEVGADTYTLKDRRESCER